jgi:hypothetical protein
VVWAGVGMTLKAITDTFGAGIKIDKKFKQF